MEQSSKPQLQEHTLRTGQELSWDRSLACQVTSITTRKIDVFCLFAIGTLFSAPPQAPGAGEASVSVSLYFDVHVRRAVAETLRLRGVEVLAAQADGTTRLPDPQLLDRARQLGRVLFSETVIVAGWRG